MTPLPDDSPYLFFDTANDYHKSAALKAAIDLDVFTQKGDGCSAKDLAARAGF